MKTQDIITYFKHAHHALSGVEPTPNQPHQGASDAPLDGYCPDLVAKICYADQVRKIIKATEKASIEGVELHHLNAPIKVVKGTKSEKGFKGLVVKVVPKDVGEGYALSVYNVFNHVQVTVSSESVKLRPYLPGERDFLQRIIRLQNERESLFTTGDPRSKVKLKDVPLVSDGITKDSVGRVISMPNKDLTVWKVSVEWDSGQRTTVALSNLLRASQS